MTLSDGARIATELVVVGIGVVPRTELAEAAGLEVRDGIVTDDTLTTGDLRILAAGDVANAWHPQLDRYLRVEHWANALNQGETAGHNLLGMGHRYERVPYFFTDQYDLGMEYSGYADASDEVVIRGSLEDREFVAFWLRDGQVVAGMNVNVWDVTDDIQALVRSESHPVRERLADPDVPLAELGSA